MFGVSRFNSFVNSPNPSFVQRGIGGAFGYDYEWNKKLGGYQSTGFLGSKSKILQESINKATTRRKKLTAKLLGKGIRGLGLAGTLFGAYRGYQQGGITGAIKETGTMVGFNIAFEGARSLWATGTSLPVLGAAAAGYGLYKFGQAAGQYGKRMSNVEMGAPMADPFGTQATLRQRSLQAIQNSHVNGRLAIGNEASLFHNMYMGR